jgi:hypothetical protein
MFFKIKLQSLFKISAINFVLTVLFYSSLTFTSFAQTHTSPKWIKSKGHAQGTDIAEMKTKALINARANALKEVGIIINTSELSIKSESNKNLTDFYTQFAESNTHGLIIEERNVKYGRVTPIDSAEDENTVYKIDVEIEALVAVSKDEPDEGFKVILESNREVYEEGEPVILTVNSSRDGFLTIFDVYNDTLNVLYPNATDKNDTIKANISFIFPTTEAYSITLKTIAGRKSSEETFIAVVTKEYEPFPNINEMIIEGKYLKLKRDVLTTYAKWLYDIPMNKRSADTKVIRVIKKEKNKE